MNQQRRKQLGAIVDRIEALGRKIDEINLAGELESITEDLEALKDEEEEYKDNMPESMQSSDKYQNAEQAISDLEGALEKLETMRDAAQEFDPQGIATEVDNARGYA